MNQPGLHLAGISKNYDGTIVLGGLDLSLPTGQMLALLGASGAGKSTLLRLIAGLEEPDAGVISFGGQAIEPGQTALVFQKPVLYPHLSIEENILFAFRLKKSAPLDREHYSSLVHTLGLGDHLKKKPAQLSGGQAQRAGIARALVRLTPVVLFDEPLSSVDETSSASIRSDVQLLHTQLGFTGIYVTHDQNEALQMGQRVAVLSGGRLAQVGTPEQLLASPASAEVAHLVFPLYNSFDAQLAGRAVRAGLNAFAFSPGHQLGGLTAVVRSSWQHTAGLRVEIEVVQDALVTTEAGELTIPEGTVLTTLLTGRRHVETGHSLNGEINPAGLHLFSA